MTNENTQKNTEYLEALHNMLLKNLTDRLGNPIYQVKDIKMLEDCVEVQLNDRDNTILQYRVTAM